MNITSINTNNFTPRVMNAVQYGYRPLSVSPNLSFCSRDTFERQSFDISEHLPEIKLKKRINAGNEAVVYNTNFDGYVVRVEHGTEFKPEELEMLEPDSIIVASDKDDKIRLMKFVQGEPLYSKDWNMFDVLHKDEYIKYFHKIMDLPDETFSEYMNDIINIRKSGYDIDDINPNNLLLDGKHINIVDLDKLSVEPKIKLSDFNPLINKYHISQVLKEMSHSEIDQFSDDIRAFYDRMIKIAQKQGQNLFMPPLDNTNFHSIEEYLYHKDWDMLDYYSGLSPISFLMKKETKSFLEVE